MWALRAGQFYHRSLHNHMPSELRYCKNLFNYSRRESREVTVGNVKVGGGNPVVVQSMITSDTRDTQACVKEVLQLADAGCEVVRITAQTRKYAQNLENIRDGVRAANCGVPLVADIHFKPDAAFEAAKWVEKVRVNPGNYVDKKKFEIREYTDEQYEEELRPDSGGIRTVGRSLQGPRPCGENRNESWFALRPYHESLR